MTGMPDPRKRRKLPLSAAVVSVLAVAAGPVFGGAAFAPEDYAHWSLRSIENVQPPPVTGASEIRNSIDAFIVGRLEAEGIVPAPEASPETLVRRVYIDVLGRTPSPDETGAFVSDRSPFAWEKLVDRLLESPEYGERMARHWLDLVRYAESNGFKSDEYRPTAWKYRDWVIRAFNADLPYDRFIQMQLAGDELEVEGADAVVATGYLRLWPYESNQRNAHQQWSEILDNITDVSGEVFLGLSLSCARCHDHKFDPILQEDYFRFRAFFAGLYPVNNAVVATAQERERHERESADWEQSTAELRREMQSMMNPWMERMQRTALSKFHPEFQEIYNKPEAQRTALDEQLRLLIGWQLELSEKDAVGRMNDGERKRYDALRSQLQAFDALKPPALSTAIAVREVGPEAPPMTIPGEERRGPVPPGFLTILERDAIPALQGANTSGRRTALAKWIGSPDNPLSSRVMVNRLWQHYFGEGLVATPNDFGRQGDAPTHPGLLDWLAHRFVSDGWSVKSLSRLMLTSAVYREASVVAPGSTATQVDPDNRLLWRMRVRRLNSEQIRDSMLAATGELDPAMGGPGVEDDVPRRSVYLRFLRNERPEIATQFDGPDGFNSCPRRDETTTPTQSLFLMNADWPLQRARALAAAASKGKSDPHSDAAIDDVYARALARPATQQEREFSREFLSSQQELLAAEAGYQEAEARREALVDLCHALLVSNAFLHVD